MVETAEGRPRRPLRLPTVSGGSGPRFLRETGSASVLDRGDADVLELQRVLDDTPFTGTVFLVSRTDVAAGELPDAIVTSLRSSGIRGLIAPGFEKRLYERSFAAGVLPVVVHEEALDRLVRALHVEPSPDLTVDLEEQLVLSERTEPIRFEVDPRLRNKLLLGLGELDEMLRYSDDAEALRSADRTRRPWLYEES